MDGLDPDALAILGEDACRDVFALIRACLRNDDEGARAVARHCADPATVMLLLAQLVADRIGGGDVPREISERWLDTTQRNIGLL